MGGFLKFYFYFYFYFTSSDCCNETTVVLYLCWYRYRYWYRDCNFVIFQLVQVQEIFHRCGRVIHGVPRCSFPKFLISIACTCDYPRSSFQAIIKDASLDAAEEEIFLQALSSLRLPNLTCYSLMLSKR